MDSSLLTFGLFLMRLALAPNLRVESVSSRLYLAGLQVMIRLVCALPPRDSCKTLVNLLSLYGICVDLPSVS